MPFTAYALIKNLDSQSNELRFREFTLSKIRFGDRARLDEVKNIFPWSRVFFDDWLYERVYDQLPPVAEGEQDLGVGRIPLIIEDCLLIFRLFKIGDICFSAQTIRGDDGALRHQYPYWAMSEINTVLRYRFEQQECDIWHQLAEELPTYQGWNSNWFRTARRFFLSGGAKEFNLYWDIVERIVDHMISLEAILSTDKDYLRRQLSERGTRLLDPPDPAECARLIKRFYDVRSKIAHGSQLSERDKQYVRDNRSAFEAIVRNILIAALRILPSDDEGKIARLQELFEISDQDLSDKVEEIYLRISTDEERRRLIARLNVV